MNNEIHKELKEISPLVANLIESQQKSYVDETYFESSEEQLLSIANIKAWKYLDTLEKPGLEYFEYLERKLVKNTSNEYRMSVPSVWIQRHFYKFAAAGTIILMSLIALMTSVEKASTNESSVASYSEEDLWQYIEDNPRDFTTDQLVDAQLIDSLVIKDISYYEVEHENDEKELFFESEIQF